MIKVYYQNDSILVPFNKIDFVDFDYGETVIVVSCGKTISLAKEAARAFREQYVSWLEDQTVYSNKELMEKMERNSGLAIVDG